MAKQNKHRKRNEEEYKKFLQTGILVPIKFQKPKQGWDFNEITKWKKQCKKLYDREQYKNQKQSRLKYHRQNKQKISKRKKLHRQNNIQHYQKQRKKSYQKNRQTILKRDKIKRKEERIKHPQKVRQRKRRYQKSKKDDYIYMFGGKIRRNIIRSFKRCNTKKDKKSHNILGISVKDFILYISELLLLNNKQYGTNWTLQNHGKVWVLDHRIPLAFARQYGLQNNSTEQEIKQHITNLCHYLNYQPLDAIQNLKKGDKLPE